MMMIDSTERFHLGHQFFAVFVDGQTLSTKSDHCFKFPRYHRLVNFSYENEGDGNCGEDKGIVIIIQGIVMRIQYLVDEPFP